MQTTEATAPNSTADPAEGNPAYAAFHAPRFAFVADLVAEAVGSAGRVLDVGHSPLTDVLASRLGRPIDSLGLEPDAVRAGGRQYRFDLNEAQERSHWRTDLGPYDMVVFAEVVEHLYTAPELALAYLRHLLVPGGLLLLQTPNAVSLRKRVKLLLGDNPYERIRTDRSNPGHFREYTCAEMEQILEQAGFTIDRVWRRYYFDARYSRHETGHEPPATLTGALKNVVYRLLPGPLREGITVLARRQG
jgi:hypothetical protein